MGTSFSIVFVPATLWVNTGKGSSAIRGILLQGDTLGEGQRHRDLPGREAELPRGFGGHNLPIVLKEEEKNLTILGEDRNKKAWGT